jgi:serine/threonine-protein kinase RsbW
LARSKTISSQICRAAEFESLASFRDLIDATCTGRAGLDENTVYDLKLAVDEACTNIITHGYSGMNPGSIILNLNVNENQIAMTITDFGHQFEPVEGPAPDVQAGLEEDRPVGGFGLYFIYQTMDEVHYETSEDGNRLTLIKRLSALEEEEQ